MQQSAAASAAAAGLRRPQQHRDAVFRGEGHSNVHQSSGLHKSSSHWARNLAALHSTGPGASAVTGGVSRRISPVISVLEDGSSATSTDSLTPAAWHAADRKLLEDTPVRQQQGLVAAAVI